MGITIVQTPGMTFPARSWSRDGVRLVLPRRRARDPGARACDQAGEVVRVGSHRGTTLSSQPWLRNAGKYANPGLFKMLLQGNNQTKDFPDFQVLPNHG